jgi:hypothetical protein
MRWATGAELAVVLAFGTTLIMQANAASAPPARPVPARLAPSSEQIAAAVALAERLAERVNGPKR